jgi:hypothetical protein
VNFGDLHFIDHASGCAQRTHGAKRISGSDICGWRFSFVPACQFYAARQVPGISYAFRLVIGPVNEPLSFVINAEAFINPIHSRIDGRGLGFGRNTAHR